MPLLAKAERVVLAGAEEDDPRLADDPVSSLGMASM
jgi:hypothetical protein